MTAGRAIALTGAGGSIRLGLDGVVIVFHVVAALLRLRPRTCQAPGGEVRPIPR